MKVRSTTTIEMLELAADERATKAAEQRRDIPGLTKQRDDVAAALEEVAAVLRETHQLAERNEAEAADLYEAAAQMRADSGIPPRTRPDDPGPDRTSPDGPGHARTPVGRIVATKGGIDTDTKPVAVQPKGGAK